MVPISFAIALLLGAGGFLLLLSLWLGWQRYAFRAPMASDRFRRLVLVAVVPPAVLGALVVLYLVSHVSRLD